MVDGASSSSSSGSLAFPGGAPCLSLPPLRGAHGPSSSPWRCDLPSGVATAGSGSQPVHPMTFALEGASRSARLVAKQLLQGSPKERPSVVSTAGVHTRPTLRCCQRCRSAFGQTLPASDVFRPRGCYHLGGFLLPRRAGLLHPAPTLGFTGFPRPSADLLDRVSFPPVPLALQSVPHVQSASPRHRGALAPLPLQVASRGASRCPARLRGLLPWPCPLRPSPLPVTTARGSHGLPFPGTARPPAPSRVQTSRHAASCAVCRVGVPDGSRRQHPPTLPTSRSGAPPSGPRGVARRRWSP